MHVSSHVTTINNNKNNNKNINKINKNKILSTHFIRREICLDICNIQIMVKMNPRH